LASLGFFLSSVAHAAIVGAAGLSPNASEALSGAVRGSAGPRRFHVTGSPAVLRELREALATAASEAQAERRHARAGACKDAWKMNRKEQRRPAWTTAVGSPQNAHS